MLLTLPDIKEHLHIELENPHQDDLLARLGASAEAWACSFLNVASLEEFDSDSSPPASPFVLPEDLKTGLLFHVEAAYSRDQALMEVLFKRAEWLVYPYRKELGV